MNRFASAIHNCQNQLFLLALALLQRAHQILYRQRFTFLNAQNQVLGGVFAVRATLIDAKVDSSAEAFPDDVASASQVSINKVVNPGVLVDGFVASEKTLKICFLAMVISNLEQFFVLKVKRFVEREREHVVFCGAVSSL